MAKAKKKKEKELLTNQLNELKTEQSEKENQVVTNDETLKKLKDELLSLKNELDLTNKIKTGANITLSTGTVIIDGNLVVSGTSQTDLNVKDNIITVIFLFFLSLFFIFKNNFCFLFFFLAH